MKNALERQNISNAFAIQRAVFPFLMPQIPSLTNSEAYIPSFHSVQSAHLTSATCDVCVAAPTGQGKTLAFAVPLIHSIENRVRPGLRAIVVLPTKDLAMQVFNVFSELISSINFYNSKHSTRTASPLLVSGLIGNIPSFEEDEIIKSHGRTWTHNPDIMIATPGRLVEFMSRVEEGGDSTLKKVFGCVETLVLDEADKILAHPVVGWVQTLKRLDGIRNMRGGLRGASRDFPVDQAKTEHDSEQPQQKTTTEIQSMERQRHASASSSALYNQTTGLRKWLFSATLAHSADLLASINLHRPLFIMTSASKMEAEMDKKIDSVLIDGEDKNNVEDQQQNFTLPKELKQQYAVSVDNDSKIALTAWVILRRWMQMENVNSLTEQPAHMRETKTKPSRVVVFCATKETSHRLSRILQLLLSLNPLQVAKFVDGWSLKNLDGDLEMPKEGDVTFGGGEEEGGAEQSWERFEEEDEFFDEDDEEAVARRKRKKKEEKEKRKIVNKEKNQKNALIQSEVHVRQNALLEGLRSDLGRSLALLMFFYKYYNSTNNKDASTNIQSNIWDFSADLSQQTRAAILKKFKTVHRGILICSDVAARGLDIDHLDLVVNYDLPSNTRRYVHRAGRTARAGQEGGAMSIVTPKEIGHLKRLLSTVNGGFASLKRQMTPKRATEDIVRLTDGCLTLLKEVLTLEDRGVVDRSVCVSAEDVIEKANKEAKNSKTGSVLSLDKIFRWKLWGLKFEYKPSIVNEIEANEEIEFDEPLTDAQAPVPEEEQNDEEETKKDEQTVEKREFSMESAVAAAVEEEKETEHDEVQDAENAQRLQEKKEKRKKEKEDARKKKRKRDDDY
eukprot:GDKJ01014850.1.p1 GENE.GDKJ01014850.1~~GDKJ01014850.1.p1  ORF type:complete len:982 (-),score=276.88 GDKJ01014850.1:107-2635(-)